MGYSTQRNKHRRHISTRCHRNKSILSFYSPPFYIYIYIYSFYTPPLEDISVQELTNMIYSFNSPVLVVGDFNGWNSIWGSSYNNDRGKLLKSLILDTELSVLNDKSPTHLSTRNTFFLIDLSLCSIALLPLAYWKSFTDLHRSNHFPIKFFLKILH